MNQTRFVLNNLRYHWQLSLALCLGTFVCAAVISGSLFVGDSLKTSLKNRVYQQLNNTQYSWMGGRFINEKITKSLPGINHPAILLQGAVFRSDNPTTSVSLIGCGENFHPDLKDLPDGAILPANTASKIRAKEGDSLEISAEKGAAIPRSSLLGKRDKSSSIATFKVKVVAILPPDHPLEYFSLTANSSLPINLFMNLPELQAQIGQSGKINTILSHAQPLAPLQSAFQQQISPADWSLKVRPAKKLGNYFSVESGQQILNDQMVSAIQKAAQKLRWESSPTLTYLANSIEHQNKAIPYSIVAAISPNSKGTLKVDENLSLKKNEIALVNWPDSPLKVRVGDQITLRFFEPEIETKLQETSATFTLTQLIPLQGLSADPDLVPEFPGITEVEDIRNWKPPFDYDNTRIKTADERYWKQYRTTPKAYISMDTAQEIWGSKFGKITSVRVATGAGINPEQQNQLETAILAELDIKAGGFVFDPVEERLLAGTGGSTDFGMLFLGFSFFLIVAALMLVVLLTKLNVERRSAEIGLMRAIGYTSSQIRTIFVREGMLISIIGALLGVVGGIVLCQTMLTMLSTLWPSAAAKSILQLSPTLPSGVIGFVSSLAVSMLVIIVSFRRKSIENPIQLLKHSNESEIKLGSRRRFYPILAGCCLLVTAILMSFAPSLPPGEPQAGAFFGSGSLVLTALLLLFWYLLNSYRTAMKSTSGYALRNVFRQPTRSLLTTGILSAAIFLLIAVESFRRSPEDDFANKEGGSGGFAFLMELETPIYGAMSERSDDILDAFARKWQDEGLSGAVRLEKEDALASQLQNLKTIGLPVSSGDDASCLNMQQVTRPRVIGVTNELIERGGFQFSANLPLSENTKNPWTLLQLPAELPNVFVEENTAKWMLKKSLGDELELLDENGFTFKVIIAGLLKDSVFQSEILLSQQQFVKYFPHQDGKKLWLIEQPETNQNQIPVADIFSVGLADYGARITPSAEKLSAFLQVQNTYLTTFQLLGAFGLILGATGLAIVLLRNLWDRRHELAMLRSLGFASRQIRQMVFQENAWLVGIGVLLGVVAGFSAVFPHLSANNPFPWQRLLITICGAVSLGLFTLYLSMIWSLRTNIVEELKKH
ncbi:MAG: FtsX-like permease family protein [Zavarzinella sp.]